MTTSIDTITNITFTDANLTIIIIIIITVTANLL